MPETKTSDPAGRPPDRRKLVAVLYADMVGYSRLIGLDDGETLARLRNLRSAVIDPAIDEHGGRIVQTGGDSLCHKALQQQVPIHDNDQFPDRSVRFRIGINIGDAIADGTDLHGDAVNVVARLQPECPPLRRHDPTTIRLHQPLVVGKSAACYQFALLAASM
jgi:adenylate cyclase